MTNQLIILLDGKGKVKLKVVETPASYLVYLYLFDLTIPVWRS